GWGGKGGIGAGVFVALIVVRGCAAIATRPQPPQVYQPPPVQWQQPPIQWQQPPPIKFEQNPNGGELWKDFNAKNPGGGFGKKKTPKVGNPPPDEQRERPRDPNDPRPQSNKDEVIPGGNPGPRKKD